MRLAPAATGTPQMQVSKRFLTLLEQQLAQFTDRQDLRALVVYLALPGENGKPSLVPIGQWPEHWSLPSGDGDPREPALGEARRWLALRDGSLLLGALRVDADHWPWQDKLRQRLEATAACLAAGLRLDLEQQRLGQELERRNQQLSLVVHQLRNPLAALRTFGQLLLRRLEADGTNRELMENLLAEQAQLARYVDAIDALQQVQPASVGAAPDHPLLLPPSLNSGPEPLAEILHPLLQRAAATASLQGRAWRNPRAIPPWQGDGGAVGEILANLLENAFRYSAPAGPLGLDCLAGPSLEQPLELVVWDGGPAIAAGEREAIFERGVRGEQGAELAGSGLGLALARDLARQLGGDLTLVVPASALAPDLPPQGNAFRLLLPASAAPLTPTAP